MRVDWRQLARDRGWRIEGDGFWVLVGSRQHRVMVAEAGGTELLRSRVARRAVLNRITDAELHAWQRNRVSELVGFRIDRQGVMVAETPLPADADREEWTYLAFNLARAADRFEYVLSGKDEE